MSHRLTLSHRTQSGGDDWQALTYPALLERTDCKPGGRRVAILCGGKPTGMHWRTFRRLNAEHDGFAAVSWAATAQ